MHLKAARRRVKYSRSIKTHRRKVQTKSHFKPKNASNQWNEKSTFWDNMKREGVWTDINKKITEVTNKVNSEYVNMKGLKGKKQDTPQELINVEEIELQDLQNLRARQLQKAGEDTYAKKKVKNLTIDERHAMEEILAQYKTNFKKAYLDKKVNRFWWNPQQMKKAYSRYLKQYKQTPQE